MSDTAAKDAVSSPGQVLDLRLDSAVIERELALTLPSAPAMGKDEAELEQRALPGFSAARRIRQQPTICAASRFT
jgi:hypothetical protein